MDPREQFVPVSLAGREYHIVIKFGLLREIGRRLLGLNFSGKVAIVTDSTVSKLYAGTVLRSLRDAGYEPHAIVTPSGEGTKTLRWVSRLIDELVAARFERGSLLLALGGGVVGDLTGFVSAIYRRGIPFIQIPTTLVAQVDSSVGGKTGVNHLRGKNLIGAFYQPRQVLIDPDALETLPRRQWVAGLAEVIKYGMIADEAFFDYLERYMEALLRRENEPVAYVIRRSCEIKAAVVAQDEREADRRRILNYGHTIGHALEALGRYRTLMHGEAVGIGMVQEASLAQSLGICTREVLSRQRAMVRRAGLPGELPAVDFPELWSAMQHDKKVVSGQVHCVLPERIGSVRIEALDRSDVKRWFSARNEPREGGVRLSW
jgi:3-dehydroquinate synthase